MSFFNQIYQKLFANLDKQTLPPIKEVLQRNEQEMNEYQAWKGTENANDLVKSIHQAYHYKKTGIISNIQVHLFNSPAANGFALTYQPNWGKKVFKFLMERSKEIVLQENYFVQAAERQILDKSDYVETIEKYYLKPNIFESTKAEQISNQRYGNVLLEEVYVDDQPSYFKCLIMSYQDRQFTQALDYNSLIDKILSDF
jgi:hypothetical protein